MAATTAGRIHNAQQRTREHSNLMSDALRPMGANRNHHSVNFSYHLEKY